MTVVGLAWSASAAPTQSKEFTFGSAASSSLGTYPQDCAATYNGNRAAIRFANPSSNDTVISIFQLHATGLPSGALATIGGVQNGVAMKSGIATDLSDPTWGYWPSDRIELTNNIGVSIGSGLMGSIHAPSNAQSDETYIEVFDVGSTSPAFLIQFVLPLAAPTSLALYDVEHAGNANDVAITRDGAWAVVNSDNWIHVVNLANPKGPNGIIPFNIGKYAYTQSEGLVQWDWPCSPNQAVNSIALTNDRAVVTTARPRRDDGTTPLGQIGVPTTWVYIIDFNGPNGPEIVLEHDLAPPTSWTVVGNDDDKPHDVAITPHTDLQLGAVPLAVVTTNHTVAAFNLDTNEYLSSEFAGEEWRQYQVQVDSVEMTGERAVVICDYEELNSTPPPLTLPPRWRVEVFDLSPTTGIRDAQGNVDSTEYTGPVNEDGERTHDLAIDKGFDKALIRTSFDNVVLTSILNPPPPNQLVVLPSQNGSDAYAYKSFTPGGYDSFSSDSVAISADQGGVLMAATIGGDEVQPGFFHGYVDLIQLAPTVSITQVAIVADPQSSVGSVPLDLAMSPSTNRLVVRSSDPYFLAPSGSSLEVDVVFVSLTPGVGVVDQFPGNGYQLGMDSLAAPALGYANTNKRVLSIAQDPFTAPPGFDYTHIVR